ncbi:unnamed protein product [Closterium sp. NIES-54]
MLVLVDDHSRYSTIFFLTTKDQAPAVVITWTEQCRTHFKRPISRLHFDGGGDYALLHAALLLNPRSHPQHSSSSPTELWSKAKPDAAGLRIWGCKAFVLIPPADCSRAASKLASRALECVYLGHNRDSPGYLFLHPPSSRLIRSIDVVFDESIPYYSTPPPDPLPPPSCPLAWTDTVLPPLLPPAPLLPPVAAPLPPSSSADIYDPSAPASPAHSAAPPPPSPSSSHSPPRPQGQQPQQQQQQQSGQQPVQQQQQQQRLHERIFLRRPPGFHTAFAENAVWQLRRPVYGLKQAPREWHAKLSATLGSLDFSASHSDTSLFIRSSPRRFLILVYVDDMILLSDTKADMEQLKLSLQQRLKCKDLGDLTHYMGTAITRNRPARTITLSQSHYIGQVLENFEMAQAKPVSTPLPFGHQLAPPTSPSSFSHPYAELVGLLMYAMMCTRPDLAYPISVLARFVGTGRHTTEHWQAAKRVLRYLRGTKDYVLTLGGPSPPLLSGFSESSYVDSQPDRRSSQGYGFTLGSGLVSWRSTRSSDIALSSCEAELYTGTMAAQESRWLCNLLAELGAPHRCPTLWCDNANTIHLTRDPVYHARSKHTELRYLC